MNKLYVALILLLTFNLLGQTINLPAGFCEAHEVAEKKRCVLRQVNFDSKNPVFLILIHGTFSSQDKFLDGVTLNQDRIPQDFFSEHEHNNTHAIKLTYNWTGKNSDNARINGGKLLAQGLNEIIQQCSQHGIKPKFILVGHSHGGNVIAVASNFVTKPIDCAILLATPVLRYSPKNKSGTENDLYLPRAIKELLLFYSTLDFVQTSGAFMQDFKRRYGPINGIDLYNVHLLVRGQEPSHTALYNQLIEDHILQLCQNIKILYKKNKNLVANIDPQNPHVDKLIAIKKYDPVESNPLAGVAVDTLWPNWQQFTYAQNEPDEDEISEENRAVFNNFYHKEFTDVAPFLDRTIKGAEQDICVSAVGELGRGLAAVPQDARMSAAKLCCPYDEFKKAHPNATSALQCSKLPAISNNTLNAAENKTLCMNVIGLGGRGLAALPQAAKSNLKSRCCFDEFKNKHPNASKAIGC